MSDHYIVIADHGHLRIFLQRQEPEQMSPGLTEVQGLDFPNGRQSYVENESDVAGRFQGSKQQGAGPGAPVARMGMSIDERLPLQREEERKRILDVSSRIEQFLKAASTDATWDFAAPPSVHNAVLDALSPQVRARLQKQMTKDLVNQPVSQLLSHFNA